jgi:hypothetical protein
MMILKNKNLMNKIKNYFSDYQIKKDESRKKIKNKNKIKIKYGF